MNGLKRGEVVLFSSDTVPGIGCLLSPACVKRLRDITERIKSKPFAILLADKEDIEDWIEEIPSVFDSLTDFIPGPLTLIFKGKGILPEGALSEEGKVGIRVPALGTLRKLIRDAGAPLVATSANISGRPTPFSIKDVELDVDRVIQGEEGSGIASTVLDISGEHIKLKRKGGIPIVEIERCLGKEILIEQGIQVHILYICSANLCRSPMAELHLKSLVEDIGWVKARSAGIHAVPGIPVSIGAYKVLLEEGIKSQHLSSVVAPPVLKWADIIFVMEKYHKEYLIKHHSGIKGKIVYLRNFKEPSIPKEIEDPIGKGIEMYEKVFSWIKDANKRVESYLRRKYISN